MEENEKTARLLEQRRAIQEQRKAANMAASMHRNKASDSSASLFAVGRRLGQSVCAAISGTARRPGLDKKQLRGGPSHAPSC
jgi:hypothetical protein